MKNSIYTRATLASLLALCSFSGFANDSSDGNLTAIKEQEKVGLVTKQKVSSAEISKVVNPLNIRLKAKMDKICSVTQKDLEERARKMREAEELRLAGAGKKSEEKKQKKAELAKKGRRATEERRQRDLKLAEERKQQKMKLNEERRRKAEEKKQRDLKLAEERKQQKMKLNEERRRKAEEKERATKEVKQKLADERKRKEEERRKSEESELGDKGKRAEEENKKNEELADKKKRAAEEAKQKLANKKKRKTEEAKQKEIKLAEKRKRKAEEKRRVAQEEKQRAETKKIEANVKADKTSEGCDCPIARDGLKITFSGGVHAQGYGKFSPSGDEYKYANFMSGTKDHYDAARNTIKGADVEFPKGIGNVGDYSDNVGAVVGSMLHLRAENQNEDLGIIYGADARFDVPLTRGSSIKSKDAHVFINSEYGDVRFGYQFGPEALMRVDATKIATIDGGADSDWFRRVNLEGKGATFPFYVTPRLYTEAFSTKSTRSSFRLAGEYDKAIANTLPFRVAYYSPNYAGIRFGLSYSPGYDNSLFNIKETDKKVRHVGADYGHILSAGVLYEYDFDRYKVKIGAVGEYGLPEVSDSNKHNYSEYVEYNTLKGVNLGINADYKVNEERSAHFGASFACLFQSGQPKDIMELSSNNKYESLHDNNNRIAAIKEQFGGDDKKTRYWTAGAGYKHENIYTSLTYFGSVISGDNYFNDIALGVQYDLSPAGSKSKFVPYLTLHCFTTQETSNPQKTQGTPDNKGALILSGVKFSF